MSTKTKLWKVLLRSAVCMPSLIVQWPTRIFSLLATAHYDCETGLLGIIPLTVCLSESVTISLSRNLYSSHIRYK